MLMIIIYEEDIFFEINLIGKDALFTDFSVRGLLNKLCTNR